MTEYKHLTPSDKADALEQAKFAYPHLSEQYLENSLFKGDTCAKCVMPYYNCLCGHADYED